MTGGNWNWQGEGKRGLEFPDGEEVSVSPDGRARLRYNDRSKQFELSIDGGPYQTVATVGGGSGNALAQADWYIDPVSGDDRNDGATASTALKTWAEWAERMGVGIASVAMTVNILNDLSEPFYILRAAFPFGCTIKGQRTVLHSGTLTSVTTASPTTPTDGTITDTGLPGASWSDSGPGGSSLVRMLVMTGGPQAGYAGPIAADLGGKVARYGQLFEAGTFARGEPTADTYDVVSGTTISGFGIFIDVATNATSIVVLQDLTLASSFSDFYVNNINLQVVHCEMNGGGGSVVTGTGFGLPLGTRITAGMRMESGCPSACVLHGSLATDFHLGFIDIVGRLLLQGPSSNITVRRGGVVRTLRSGEVAVFGHTGAGDVGVRVRSGGQFDTLGGIVWGVGNSLGTGVWVDSNGAFHWPDPDTAAAHYNLAMAGGDEFNIGSTPTSAAALGAGGTINAANNAMAVPNFL